MRRLGHPISKPLEKHQITMACANELYSLLPLGIETPRRREQDRVENESN
jgi:hypothetical protein